MAEEELKNLLSLPPSRLLTDGSKALRLLSLLTSSDCSNLTPSTYRRLPPRLRYLLYERIRAKVFPPLPVPEKRTWETCASPPPSHPYRPRLDHPCLVKLRECAKACEDEFTLALLECAEDEAKRLTKTLCGNIGESRKDNQN